MDDFIVDVTVDDPSILSINSVVLGEDTGSFSIQMLVLDVGRTRVSLVVRGPGGAILAEQSFPAHSWAITDDDLEAYLHDPDAEGSSD